MRIGTQTARHTMGKGLRGRDAGYGAQEGPDLFSLTPEVWGAQAVVTGGGSCGVVLLSPAPGQALPRHGSGGLGSRSSAAAGADRTSTLALPPAPSCVAFLPACVQGVRRPGKDSHRPHPWHPGTLPFRSTVPGPGSLMPQKHITGKLLLGKKRTNTGAEN